MSPSDTSRESAVVVLAQALIVAAAVGLFLWPLSTPVGLAAGLVGTVAAYLLAGRLARAHLRLGSGLVLGLAVVGLGQLLGSWVLGWGLGASPTVALALADGCTLGLTALGGFFMVRLASSRYRLVSLVELAVVVGAVTHAFAEHRHQRIHQPRFLSDWAWSRGIDPELPLAVAGVLAVAVAVLLLVRVRRAQRLLAVLLLLVVGGVLVVLLGGAPRLGRPPDTNDLGLTRNEKAEQGGGRRPTRPPDPVAVAVLHDELPEAEVLYFRQSVRSRRLGDRLVEDTSGQFDLDVPTRFPAGATVRVETPQATAFHRLLRTSMYLLVDHAQLFGLGFPTALTPKENPDPRRFVAAYDVDSLFAVRPIERLVGREARPQGWSEAALRHYLDVPEDPRYLELSSRLVREVDPRFVGDDVMKALAIKRYLEKMGFYSLAEKTLTGDDPTARFLFGDLRGYCVHFAHAAVFLLRSQGIPARVALGYGVQTSQRGAGSAVLIYGNEAHAWPELYLEGVGWVTFDIYPERSDEPPGRHLDADLETALGELARKDATGGRSMAPARRLVIPWGAVGRGLLAAIGLVLALAYAVKVGRRLYRPSPRLVYRAVLDRLSDVGQVRRYGETRERHAARLGWLTPSFPALTDAHLRLELGAPLPGVADELRALAEATAQELRKNLPWHRQLGGLLNPIGWWFTR